VVVTEEIERILDPIYPLEAPFFCLGLCQGPQREEMERLRRLQALHASQKPSKSNRKKIEARILHVHRPELDELVSEKKRKEEEDLVRKQMKAEALRRRKEEEEEQAKMKALRQQEKLQKEYEKQIYSDEVEEEQEDDEDEEEDFGEPLLKPVFVPKDSRQAVLDEETLVEEEARAQEERQKEAHSLLAEHVRISAIAKAKKKAEELEATSGAFDPRSVDDTDDVR